MDKRETPIHIRRGGVNVAIFPNKEKGKPLATIESYYMGKDGEWHAGKTFTRNKLTVLISLLEEALTRMPSE